MNVESAIKNERARNIRCVFGEKKLSTALRTERASVWTKPKSQKYSGIVDVSSGSIFAFFLGKHVLNNVTTR